MTTAALPLPASGTRTLNVSLWIAQVLLFAMFAMAGGLKLFMPVATLAQTGEPIALIRFIGIAEVLGAIGLLLPAITRIKPWLTPLAALGLGVIMVLATGFHVMRGEFSALGAPIALGAAAAFIAWGRFRQAPIEAREAR
jgi:hypothetical protein